MPEAVPSGAHGPLTAGVLAGQLGFLGVLYGHGYMLGHLRWSNAHISGLLDDPVPGGRADLCSIVAIVSGAMLLSLEESRSIGANVLRLALACCTNAGILLTCLVRESVNWHVHSAGAALAFGAATLLVWVVVGCQPPSVRLRCSVPALVLSAAVAATSAAQALHLLRVIELPAAGLALGECAMVVIFGASIASVGVRAGPVRPAPGASPRTSTRPPDPPPNPAPSRLAAPTTRASPPSRRRAAAITSRRWGGPA